ncbi:MAG: hypothetical protein H7835_12650 [Magnetococcus sp. XQGC-1]
MFLALAVLIMVMTTALLEALDPDRQALWASHRTAELLARSKEALVAYAMAGPNPGELPCPDMDASLDGRSDVSCGSPGKTAVGLLPWRTLGLPPTRDVAQAFFWYAVSGRRKPGGAESGQLLHLVKDPLRPLAAVVIAPGFPLRGQRRGHGAGKWGDLRKAYLEGANLLEVGDDDDLTFESAVTSSVFNDRLLVLEDQLLLSLPSRNGDGP